MPFSKIKLTRLTSSGSAWGGIISPDGKYLCYIQRSPQDQLSMNLRQLATDTEIVLLTLPEKAYFTGGRRFSDDGNYIYYVTSSSNKSFLYRMPVLGGISQKLVDDIDYIPAISPDGKKIAFTREVEEKCILMIANVDGSNQQKLKTATAIEYYTDLEWSPDGKMLVAILLTKSGGNKRILSIDAKDGSVRTLIDLDTSEFNNDLEWLSDQSGMILTKQTENRGQIYYLSYPNYKLTPITNDFNNYTGMLTVTQDSKSIVTTQASYNSSLWGAAYAKPDSVTQLTTGSFIVDGEIGISWSYDGRIIYTALDSSGVVQISVINSDGTNKKQLTAGKPDKYWAAESANGKSIVYMGEGGQIWIMGSNGENPKQLPTSKFVRFPRISSDGKWIIYSSYAGEKHTLFKFDIESAKEMILAVHSTISSSAISPDGRFIAYTHHDGSENTLKIIPSEGGKPIKEFPLKEEVFAWGRIHWTPDGRGIGYILGEENGGNIYVQPVDGSPAYRLTNFKDDDKLYLSNFSWSSDGKQIAYSRGKSNSDIVMIQNLP